MFNIFILHFVCNKAYYWIPQRKTVSLKLMNKVKHMESLVLHVIEDPFLNIYPIWGEKKTHYVL